MSLPKIGITMGDPTGIGPEIIAKALSMEEPFKFCRPFVFGDEGILTKIIQRYGLEAIVESCEKVPEEAYNPKKIYFFPSTKLDISKIYFGKPDRTCGLAMAKYIEDAVNWIKNGFLDALTTCPINKEAINRAGFPFPGHTEFIAHLAAVPTAAMMFLTPRWKIILVTTHMPLKEVPNAILKDKILNVIRLANNGLKKYFKISEPRIAVLGLNPHCGEDGLLGHEEITEIIPAIEEAKKESIKVEGPFPADSFFNLERNSIYDAVISMYHDQGLIPVKMFDFREAVNITLGLPFIRTSVSHGTAYDIAGKGIADPTNFIKALSIASNLSKLKNDF